MAKSLTKEENILLTLINAFQNDEKEKLNHLVNISKSLIEVREKVKEEMEKLPPQFNVFNSINLLNHENYNSNLFANFLDIKFKYNDNEISFAKLFLKYLTEEFGWEFDLENIKIKDIEIKRELLTEEGKRIDIFIGYKEKFAVIIENKIWAEDGYKQLENYYNYVKSQEYDKIYMIYLTPYEREPSEESLSKELYQKEGSELYEKFKNIKHEEIGKWIKDSILENEEFSFLHNEDKENNKNDYKLLKSALIQIIDNEKSISGENEEGDMTETEIKKVLKENLFKELEAKGELTESELDKYIEMFDKAKDLLVKEKITIIIKKYLKFTKEINKYLNKNIKYELKSDKDIINNVINENFATHIYFKVNKIEIKIGSSYWIEKNNDIGSDYLIIIPKEDKSIKNKLKNNIKKFPNLEFEDQEENNRYYYEIDINNDKPEEIANAIDKLYELLKKEIK
ncbi:hypothetical protein EPJ66_09325 [Brachyspira aalborgi]|uniref:PDDEXK-like family protein n=1 Tax=Brachyspira aalborgi TaxID=29522 RepID=UPI0011CC26FF|nr:PD-(D/E)XK nuclease family protein [Brachyspira aalborgi]TXJ50881.1 hypothetical protein EPJ66_09325 [Brachyspira aalborgi]